MCPPASNVIIAVSVRASKKCRNWASFAGVASSHSAPDAGTAGAYGGSGGLAGMGLAPPGPRLYHPGNHVIGPIRTTPPLAAANKPVPQPRPAPGDSGGGHMSR